MKITVENQSMNFCAKNQKYVRTVGTVGTLPKKNYEFFTWSTMNVTQSTPWNSAFKKNYLQFLFLVFESNVLVQCVKQEKVQSFLKWVIEKVQQKKFENCTRIYHIFGKEKPRGGGAPLAILHLCVQKKHWNFYTGRVHSTNSFYCTRAFTTLQATAAAKGNPICKLLLPVA